MNKNETILRTTFNLITTFIPVFVLIISLIISIGIGIKILMDTFMLWLLATLYLEGLLRSHRLEMYCLNTWENPKLLILWGILGTLLAAVMITVSLVSPKSFAPNPIALWLIYLTGLIYAMSVRLIAIVKHKITNQQTAPWFNYFSCYCFGVIISRIL